MWSNVRALSDGPSNVVAKSLNAQGTSYVAWPRLNPPYEILRYEGAGYRSPVRGRGVSFVTPGFVGAVNRHQRDVSKRPKSARTEEIELGRRKGNLID